MKNLLSDEKIKNYHNIRKEALEIAKEARNTPITSKYWDRKHDDRIDAIEEAAQARKFISHDPYYKNSKKNK